MMARNFGAQSSRARRHVGLADQKRHLGQQRFQPLGRHAAGTIMDHKLAEALQPLEKGASKISFRPARLRIDDDKRPVHARSLACGCGSLARDDAAGQRALPAAGPRPKTLHDHSPSAGSQDYVGDSRNDNVFISVNGELTPRPQAKVSVFDAGFVLGDGVWEGLRLHDGRIAFLDRHLDRLWAAPRCCASTSGLTRETLTERLFDVVDANGMKDGVHIRLMVTRGVKRSPYQDPRLTVGAATIVIIPEWKVPRPEMLAKGLDLFTVHIRRTGPAEQDQKLNSHSKLNCILACIQAMEAGADEALMLDDRGFVATCNSTHFFIVRGGELWTSGGGYCLGGITRDAVLARGAAGWNTGLREGLLAVRRLFRR